MIPNIRCRCECGLNFIPVSPEETKCWSCQERESVRRLEEKRQAAENARKLAVYQARARKPPTPMTEERRARVRAYYRDNRERIIAQKRAWYAAHRDEQRAYQKWWKAQRRETDRMKGV